MTAPLTGLLVADFSRVLAGPLATMTLADLGATVVKVERPGSGDDTRTWGPPWTGSGTSSYFYGVNRSKYSVALDLDDDADRATARELAARADVLVENFRPGGLDEFGLGYHTVAAVNPGIVYCTVSGFGAAAGRERPGYDFLVQAVGGLMSITGDAAGEPRKVGVALVDVLTGKDAVIGVLAALAARAVTGRGEHVEVDLLSSLLGGMANQVSGYLASGVAPARMGNRHPSIAPYETVRCADGLLAIACGNDRQFRRLAVRLGRPELAADVRFATNPDRVAHREELVAELESVLLSADVGTWERRLTGAGVPAGPVADIGDAVARAERYGLDPLVRPDAGEPAQIRHPVRYAHGSVAPAVVPPTLGQHSELVRHWLAGRSDVPLGHPSTQSQRGTPR